MTEIEALRKTVIIWDYLAQHPTTEKREAYHILGLEPDFLYCPLCDFCHGVCKKCPLINYWPGGHCANPGSSFIDWILIQTPEPAQEIADAARARIEELIS